MSAPRILRGPVLPTVLAVTVVGASATGAVALISAGRGAEKAAPTAPAPVRNAAWTVDGAHDAPNLSALSGVWITPDLVVRGAVDGLHAVKRSDGSTAWDLPLPVEGDAVCSMSPTAGDGVGVVSFTGKDGDFCGSAAAVELATGRLLWTAKAPAITGNPDADAAAVALDGDVALVDVSRPRGRKDGQSVTSVVGLDAHSGEVKWKHTTACDHSPSAFVAGGGKVAVVEPCESAVSATVLDSATGAQLLSIPSAQLKKSSAVLSISPLVVADDSTRPLALVFGSAPETAPASAANPATPVSDLGSLFSPLAPQGLPLPRAAVGAGVVCATATRPSCWSASGKPLALRGLPEGTQGVVAVTGSGAEARILTLPTPTRPRASVCRVGADGAVVVEADLALPVSDFVGRQGLPQVSAYGDAKELVLVAWRPSGGTAVVDVR